MLNIHQSDSLAEVFAGLADEDAIWDRLVTVAGERYGITSMLYAFTHSRFTSSRTGITNSLFLRHNHAEDYLASFPNGLSLDDDIAAELILQGRTEFLWEEFRHPGSSSGAARPLRHRRGHGHGVRCDLRFSLRRKLGLRWSVLGQAA